MSLKTLKQRVNFGIAIAAAGFKIANHKSTLTEDGAFWHATLMHDRTKIVTVSNGGYGGDDESEYHATTKAGKDAAKANLVKLFAIPEVLTVVREYKVLSDADYEKRKAEIYSTTPEPTVECIEFLVNEISLTDKLITAIKRAMKTKLVVAAIGDDANGTFSSIEIADTPAARAMALKQLSGQIDYFVADLFDTSINQGAGQ